MIPLDLQSREIGDMNNPVKRFVSLLNKNGVINSKEGEVVSAIIKNGKKIDARSIVKAVGMHTSSTYKILDDLLKKSLIMKDKFNGKYYFWIDPVNPINDIWVKMYQDVIDSYDDFCELHTIWNQIIKPDRSEIYFGKKVFHHFETNEEFLNVLTYIIDSSREEMVIGSLRYNFVNNLRCMAALKRASERGVEIMAVVTDKAEKMSLKRLSSIDVKMRKTSVDELTTKLGLGFLISDSKNGIMLTSYVGEGRTGTWFLNKEHGLVKNFHNFWKTLPELEISKD